MNPILLPILLCFLLFASCKVQEEVKIQAEVPLKIVEPTPVEPVVVVPEMFLLKLARACAFDIYHNESIGLNTRLFVYQLDAKFTRETDTFTVRINEYEVTKVASDSMVFFNFFPDSVWHRLSLDSAGVEVTCIYEVTGLERHPLPVCVNSSYSIRQGELTSNLDLKYCY